MEKELLKFCAEDDPVRTYLNEPFTIENHTYCSNGHAIIRTKSDREFQGKVPIKDPVLKMFSEQDIKKHNFMKCPEYEAKGDKCRHCNGAGKDFVCYECDGWGRAEVENFYSEYEVECQSCLGSVGKVKFCAFCGGYGHGDSADPLLISNKVFINAKEMMPLLDGLADVKISEPTDPEQPIYFIFKNGDGLIMPFRHD